MDSNQSPTWVPRANPAWRGAPRGYSYFSTFKKVPIENLWAEPSLRLAAEMDFLRHDSGVPCSRKNAGPGKVFRQCAGRAPGATRPPGPEYLPPVRECAFAEPDPISPDGMI